MKRFPWNLSILAVTFSLLALLPACTVEQGAPAAPSAPVAAGKVEQTIPAPQTASGEPVFGDSLVEIIESEPAVLNLFLDAGDAQAAMICGSNIFESLLERDNVTLEWKPFIAERWEIADDHLTYTFHLRKDAHFSDGTPITAHDVKFSYDAIINPANDTAGLRNYYQDVSSVDVPDDHTIIFHCKQPYFLHLNFLAGGLLILPRHVYGQGDFNKGEFNRRPVGSGPYVFDSWTTNQQIVLKRDPNYWGPEKPFIDRMVYKVISDANAAIQVLESGEADFYRITPELWTTRASSPQFAEKFAKYEIFSPGPGYLGSYGWIGWNIRRPQFQDKRVRQALTMLLDRETILETLFHGLGRVTSGHFFQDAPEANPDVKPWPFDPAAAYKLLDEAGWVDTDQDGIRDKGGVPLRFEWSFFNGIPEYERMATVYKEELDKAGIDVLLRPLEWATFLESVIARKFDACMMAWANPIESDPYQIWHSSQAEKGDNNVGFINAEADQLIEQARLSFDQEERVKLYRRFHEILHDEQPYTFLYNRQYCFAVAKRFQNVKVYLTGFDMHEWWVPADQQKYK